MMHGLFHIIHSLLRPMSPVKEVVDEYFRREEGQKALRRANGELMRIEQQRPKYISTDGLLKQKP